MAIRLRALLALALLATLAFLLASTGCYPNPQPPGLSPVPTLPAGQTPTPAPQVLTPLGRTPTLFIPESMGEQVPFVPQMQTAVAPPPVSTLEAEGAAAAVPVPVAAGQVSGAVGATLYIESCLCHGSQGQGISAPALRNSQFVQIAGDQALYTVVAYGRNNTGMPAWKLGACGPMTDAQITSTVAYLHALQDVPPAPTATPASQQVPPPATPAPASAQATAAPTPGPTTPATDLAGDAARGRIAFGPYCAGCHGPEGLQGIANPGSSAGRVPVLNPIAPAIASPATTVFATNLYQPIQNGRVPAGPSPEIVMPAFGGRNLLSQQSIADLIAYIIYLNQTCPGLSCG